MGVSAKRPRRENAGNKMVTMIEEERAKIQNGEVPASDEDEEYARGLVDAEDIIDSDFTETDSEAEKAADDASKEIEALLEKAERKRKRKLAKKIIVPRFAAAKRSTTKRGDKKETVTVKANAEVDEEVDAVDGNASAVAGRRKQKQHDFAVRFSSRTSVVRKAQEAEARHQKREFMAAVKRGRRKRDSVSDEPELTQEQLLEEAKQTETENLEKLREFQEQEAEEKRLQRMTALRKAPLLVQPVVHWKSSLVCNEKNLQKTQQYMLEHLDDEHYPLNYWGKHLSILPPKMCPITGLPARYFHPHARVPYANLQAYRILEEIMQGEHAYFYDIDVWSSTDIVE
ncbi:hypothetical protein GGI25_004301 [Coemansia spiralis]|uniref:Vps72/YL1 C-terminal domain-containing protein n=2 Tax=Coemansia TaxID=4863 RepID=A0A9W8G523_9FUNG|nr:YL1 nuclear protein-domain-containing protein [Coemansia spiralis]KAJ1995364.1 hypothetical protein EDC05_000916 [Coemansia umbellata]KAJ2624809.1 hypothetical protein GGI26_001225 [Coemansia sp. RSA 1358]KAJ2674562.1 hypothetical protein GGI25_004301 [Coemansia spiralis]